MGIIKKWINRLTHQSAVRGRQGEEQICEILTRCPPGSAAKANYCITSIFPVEMRKQRKSMYYISPKKVCL